jgi:DNA-binding protein H-NS
MAKAVRAGTRKTARKTSTPARRQQAKPGLSSDKFRALVYNLSTSELDELIKVATGRKNEELANAKASFLDEVKARAATLGMSIADLVGLGGGQKAAGPTGVKYRNPKTGETWSGRGRPARWITELEAKGQKRGKFAV